MSRAGRLAVVLAYAVATFLAFPQPVGGGVLDLGALLSWTSPALLILALHGLSTRRAAIWGFGAGLLAHTAVLHWIFVVTVQYGHAPIAAGFAAPILLAAYVALFTSAFGAVQSWLGARGFAAPWVLALLWTALDHLRSFLFTGFPWATLGYAQHENFALLPLASLAGVYGLSFVTALGGAALAHAGLALRVGRRPGMPVFAALGGVVLAHALGLALPDPERVEGRAEVRVAVAQGNIDQGVKWDGSWAERTLVGYEELTRQAASAGAQIVVWPETAVPGLPDANAALRERLSALAVETGVRLVVGAVGFEHDADGQRFYDSAYAIDATGAFTDRYDKTHLVPFGEYVPFQDLIGRFLSAMARGMATVGVTPGAAPRAVDLSFPRRGGKGSGTLRAGLPVCYELLFPDLVRRFALDGGELLLAMTNDAWYGQTGAPYQFLAITALRSAETGLWTARAANTGVSAFIDGAGHVQQQTPIFERDLLVADVPRRAPGTPPTFYTRFGDWLAWLSWAALLGLGLRARRLGVRESDG